MVDTSVEGEVRQCVVDHRGDRRAEAGAGFGQQAGPVEVDWDSRDVMLYALGVGAGAGGYFAPHIRSYIRRSKAPDHIGMLVALKDRKNGLKNPYAHLHEPDISFDSIKDRLTPNAVRAQHAPSVR